MAASRFRTERTTPRDRPVERRIQCGGILAERDRRAVLDVCEAARTRAHRDSFQKGAGGLRKGSVALCHQVTTVDRAKLIDRWGSMSELELATVEEGVRAALDL